MLAPTSLVLSAASEMQLLQPLICSSLPAPTVGVLPSGPSSLPVTVQVTLNLKKKKKAGNIGPSEITSPNTPRPFCCSSSYVGEGHKHHLPPKRSSPFSPACSANGAHLSSREGESIPKVSVKLEGARELLAINQPTACSDIAACLLTMQWYCKSWAGHMLTSKGCQVSGSITVCLLAGAWGRNTFHKGFH